VTRYYARSASDKTDDWPFWFVADEQRGGLNVTADLIRKLDNPDHSGGVLLPPWESVKLAMKANRKIQQETAS
jgi:hypothetical protein